MISKALKATSFYHTARYVLQKEGAEVLLAEGVRSHDFKLMADDFLTQQQMRPGKEKAGGHFILSFHPSEKPTDALMKKLAQEYLTRLGVVNTQFAIVKHTDRNHLHLHIIANLVDNEGKAIPDSWIGLRGKKIAQQLTREYKLVPAIGKARKLDRVELLNESEAVKYQIYEAIAQHLPLSRSFEDFRERLLKSGIETQYKYKGKTDEVQGISFKKGSFCFKGSEIDRNFSYGNLKKTLKAEKQPELSKSAKPLKRLDPAPLVHPPSFSTKASSQSSTPGNAIPAIVLELLKPVASGGGSAPYELSEEERRRRKKKKRPFL